MTDMRSGYIRDRLMAANDAAELLSNANAVLTLAAEAIGEACPRAKIIGFTRGANGLPNAGVFHMERESLATRPQGRVPWIVDLDNVPEWQRNTWIEPVRARIHGPDYFSNRHPVARLLGARRPPDYGRMMVCHRGRMVAWIGAYIDGSRPFIEHERAALAEVSSLLAAPLYAAAVLNESRTRLQLAPRQAAIVARVALGLSNKQIAVELGISLSTVKTVLERLFRASGARNRAGLVAWWQGVSV